MTIETVKPARHSSNSAVKASGDLAVLIDTLARATIEREGTHTR